jgi:hypothetical protein
MSKIGTNLQFTGVHLEGKVVLRRRERADIVLVVGTVRTVSAIKINDVHVVIRA